MPKSLEMQDRAYHTIRRMLLEGRITSRQDLSRRRLAVKLGVSSACVQGALGRLETERLLVCLPQSGTYLRQIDIEEYYHHRDLRELIEPYAARRAASRISAAQLASIEHSCDEMTAVCEDMERDQSELLLVPQIERAARAENLFHGTIMEASCNPTAAHFIENLRIARLAIPISRVRDRATRIDVCRRAMVEHRAILQALRAGDAAEAEKAMLLHLQQGRGRASELLALLPPSARQAAAAEIGLGESVAEQELKRGRQ